MAQVFQPFFPELTEPLPFSEDGLLPNGHPPYLAFEWIGSQNYLGEAGSRSRGANATSADFAFRFRRIFLQKVGGGYRFIHRMLLEHFAELETDQTK